MDFPEPDMPSSRPSRWFRHARRRAVPPACTARDRNLRSTDESLVTPNATPRSFDRRQRSDQMGNNEAKSTSERENNPPRKQSSKKEETKDKCVIIRSRSRRKNERWQSFQSQDSGPQFSFRPLFFVFSSHGHEKSVVVRLRLGF